MTRTIIILIFTLAYASCQCPENETSCLDVSPVNCTTDELSCRLIDGWACCQAGQSCLLDESLRFGLCCGVNSVGICCTNDNCTCLEEGSICCGVNGTVCAEGMECCGTENNSTCCSLTESCIDGTCLEVINPQDCSLVSQPCPQRDGPVCCTQGDVCSFDNDGNAECCPFFSGGLCCHINGSCTCISQDAICCADERGTACLDTQFCCSNGNTTTCCDTDQMCVNGECVESPQMGCDLIDCLPGDSCCEDAINGPTCFNITTQICVDNRRVCDINDLDCIADVAELTCDSVLCLPGFQCCDDPIFGPECYDPNTVACVPGVGICEFNDDECFEGTLQCDDIQCRPGFQCCDALDGPECFDPLLQSCVNSTLCTIGEDCPPGITCASVRCFGGRECCDVANQGPVCFDPMQQICWNGELCDLGDRECLGLPPLLTCAAIQCLVGTGCCEDEELGARCFDPETQICVNGTTLCRRGDLRCIQTGERTTCADVRCLIGECCDDEESGPICYWPENQVCIDNRRLCDIGDEECTFTDTATCDLALCPPDFPFCCDVTGTGAVCYNPTFQICIDNQLEIVFLNSS